MTREAAMVPRAETTSYYGRPVIKAPVWKWEVPVEFEFFYPKGVYVKAKPAAGEAAPKIGPREMSNLKESGRGLSTVIAVGFA